jgi:hypothetical protein
MLVELSVVEQRYHAVMEVVCGGVAVVEVAETLWGVAQDSAQLAASLPPSALPGLADRSRRPHHQGSSPHRSRLGLCELRRTHPRWVQVPQVRRCPRLSLMRAGPR